MTHPCFTMSNPPFSDEADVIGAAEMAQLRREFPGDGMREVLEMFKEEAPSALVRLIVAIQQMNLEAVRRAAHALKGCCDNFGARPMAALCREIENDARAGKMPDPLTVPDQLQIEYQRLELALEDECKRDMQP